MNKKMRLCLAFLLVPFLFACGSRFTMPVSTINVPDDQTQIDMPITLLLNDELCNLESELQVGFGGTLVVGGDTLCENAEIVAKKAFSQVHVIRGQNAESSDSVSSMAVLSPKFVDIEFSMAMWSGSPNNVTLSVEWPISSKDGKLIWTDTISGSAVAASGNRFTYEEIVLEQMQDALNDLFVKSYEGLVSSIEIRKFVKKQQ